LKNQTGYQKVSGGKKRSDFFCEKPEDLRKNRPSKLDKKNDKLEGIH
jgi:hypothetical protein